MKVLSVEMKRRQSICKSSCVVPLNKLLNTVMNKLKYSKANPKHAPYPDLT